LHFSVEAKALYHSLYLRMYPNFGVQSGLHAAERACDRQGQADGQRQPVMNLFNDAAACLLTDPAERHGVTTSTNLGA
jgi:hypothetical protein